MIYFYVTHKNFGTSEEEASTQRLLRLHVEDCVEGQTDNTSFRICIRRIQHCVSVTIIVQSFRLFKILKLFEVSENVVLDS